jgi:hypothetical protein
MALFLMDHHPKRLWSREGGRVKHSLTTFDHRYWSGRTWCHETW